MMRRNGSNKYASQKKYFKLLIKFLQNDDEHIFIIIIDYLIEENRIIKNKYEATGKRLLLNDEERRSLAKLGKPLIKTGVKDYIQIVKPDTLMRWYRPLIAQKDDSSKLFNSAFK